MSTVYLLPDDPSFDAIGWDVTIRESHLGETTPTDNPVEDGSVFTDHLIHKPETFSFDGFVSNTPKGGTFYEAATRAPKKLSVPTYVNGGTALVQLQVFSSGIERKANRVLEMWNRLEDLRLKGISMTVITSIKEYSSMVLTSVGLDREELSIGKGLFVVSMRQITVVSTESVAAPKPKEPRAVPPAKGGELAGGPLDALREAFPPGKSILKSGIDLLKNVK